MNLRVPRRLRHSLRAEAEALRSRVTFGNCHLPTQWCADDGRHVIYRHEDDLEGSLSACEEHPPQIIL